MLSAKPPQISTRNTLSNIKLPVLQKDNYDTWAMEMEHYLEYIDNDGVWNVIHEWGILEEACNKGKDGAGLQGGNFLQPKRQNRVMPPKEIWAAKSRTRSGFGRDGYKWLIDYDCLFQDMKFYKKTGRRPRSGWEKCMWTFDREKLAVFHIVTIMGILLEDDGKDIMISHLYSRFKKYGKTWTLKPKSPSPTEYNASSIVFSICPSNDSDGELGNSMMTLTIFIPIEADPSTEASGAIEIIKNSLKLGSVTFEESSKGSEYQWVRLRDIGSNRGQVSDIDVQTEEAEELLVVSSTSRPATGSEHNATKKSLSSKKPSSTPISKSADDIMILGKSLMHLL
ncbi:hypothetical protein Tco_0633519 [Tanacetum coccineum]